VTTRAPTVGVISPGAMGSAIASALARGGARVVTTVTSRSERTAELARRADAEQLTDLASVVRESDVVLSVVPPGAARGVAADIAEAARAEGARPLIADLNAVAPTTAHDVATILAQAGCNLVDGAISGPPPWRQGTTRIYLSGLRASEVAALPFDGVDTIDVGADVGSASAVKMSTASVYKGSSAILTQGLLSAWRNGVLEHVLADLQLGAPELVARAERRLASAATKAGRYVEEMHEIAITQAAADLEPALFEAMAAVYARLAETPLAQRNPEDVPADVTLADVLRGLD
jgi:3-hydroxyisobutyrate dehydrogenase-like beta-hydroxyacid dehydrogenase